VNVEPDLRDSAVVSARAFVAAWDTVLQGELTRASLGADLAEDVDRVRRTKEWVRWDRYIELLDRVRDRVGGVENLERAFDTYTHQFAEIKRIAALLVSPRGLARFILRTVCLTQFPHVQVTYEELGRDRIHLRLSLDGVERDSTSWFHACLAGLRNMPQFLELPRADVQATISSHSADIHICLPPSRTLGARIEPAARALLDELHQYATDIQAMIREVGVPRRSGAGALLLEGLTPRQREVAALVMKGLSNKEIAATLGCAERTVELHVTSLMRRTRTRNRTQLAALLLGG
jgi:DNA-binding CsgD family transcriptional regulator